MTGPVEAPALDAELLGPLSRHRVVAQSRRDRFVEIRLEGGDQRKLRQLCGQQTHRLGVGRIVGRGHVGVSIHRGQDAFVHAMDAGQSLGMHGLEADCGQLRGIAQNPDRRIGQLPQTQAHSRGVVRRGPDGFLADRPRFDITARAVRADPFHSTPGQHSLRRHVEQTILETRAAQVRNQDLHPSSLAMVQKKP